MSCGNGEKSRGRKQKRSHPQSARNNGRGSLTSSETTNENLISSAPANGRTGQELLIALTRDPPSHNFFGRNCATMNRKSGSQGTYGGRVAPSGSNQKRVFMKGKIVVLGAGFVGGALVRSLCSTGRGIRLFVRPHNQLSRLQGVLKDVELAYGDFQDEGAVEAALEGVETVCHLITTTFPA